jgi:hypothetical protein
MIVIGNQIRYFQIAQKQISKYFFLNELLGPIKTTVGFTSAIENLIGKDQVVLA